MTKIKLCGLTRMDDIRAANRLQPDYIGFVFAPASRRFVAPEQAAALRSALAPGIAAVGVFANAMPDEILPLLRAHTIDAVQLHGQETEDFIRMLRTQTDRPIIRAFRLDSEQAAEAANASSADWVLLDSGAGGTGSVFDWRNLNRMHRPYFLAGGLNSENVGTAVREYHPFAVDVSSGIETGGVKDMQKMAAFVAAVRKEGLS